MQNYTSKELLVMDEESFEMFNGKQYNIKDLEFIVKKTSTSLLAILKTQRLTPEFCQKYILDTDFYCVSDLDNYISIDDIIEYQPHIEKSSLKIDKNDL